MRVKAHIKCIILITYSVIKQLTWYKVHIHSIPIGKLIIHTVIALLAKTDVGLSTISTNYEIPKVQFLSLTEESWYWKD